MLATFSDYSAHSGASKLHKSSVKDVLVLAPIRSGKSYSLIHEIIKDAWNNNSGFGTLVAAPTFRLLQAVLERPIVEKLEYYGLKSHHSFSSHETLLKNRNKIYYRSLENPDIAMRGLNINNAYVDEAAYCSEYSIEVIRGRLLTNNGRLVQATTPNGTNNHIYNNYGAIIEGRERPDKNTEIVNYEMLMNPIITQDAIDMLLSKMDKRLAQQDIYGKFIDLADSLVYYAFAEGNLKDVTYNPDYPLYAGVDYGMGKHSAYVIGQMVGKDINIIDCGVCSTIQQVAEALKAKYGPKITIRDDAAGKVFRDIFRNIGLYNIAGNKSNPRRVERYARVNAQLENGLGDRHLFINPNTAKDLVTELKTLSFNANSDKPNTVGGSKGHLTDGLGYLINYLFTGAYSDIPIARLETLRRGKKLN